jgi:hypothetical protein
MLKKIYVTVIAILILGINLSAQKTDQVTLKNGSIIRGNIVKIVPDGNITINDRAGNTWVYSMNEIQDITKVKREFAKSGTGFSSGWANMTTIGFLAGSQSSSYIAPFSIQTSIGYRNNSGFYTGFLTGLEFINVTHIPVMFDFQYSLRDGDVSPVLIARAGYALPSKFKDEMYNTTYTYRGGVAGAVGVGLKIRNKDIFAWDVSVLYRYMQINYTEDYEWQEYQNNNEFKDVYNRLELRLGFYLGR